MPVTFNSTIIHAELNNIDIMHDLPIDITSEVVKVAFTKSKNDHHDQNFIKAKNYYKTGQSPIAKIQSIGNYYLMLVPK